MALDPTAWIVLVVAGLAAGSANTVAGGGSLLTLPALMLVGLPADVANGTNRLGVVSQSLSGIWGFARAGRIPRAEIGPILAPTLIGAMLGAVAASWASEEFLADVLLLAMTGMALLMAVAPRAVTAGDEASIALRERPSAVVGLFAAGFYGGFVQAGVGFLLLGVLGGALRHDPVRANALKLVCTSAFSLAALGVFLSVGRVAWGPGVVLAVSTMLGARFGVALATRVPRVVLERVLLIAVVTSCVAAWTSR